MPFEAHQYSGNPECPYKRGIVCTFMEIELDLHGFHVEDNWTVRLYFRLCEYHRATHFPRERQGLWEICRYCRKLSGAIQFGPPALSFRVNITRKHTTRRPNNHYYQHAREPRCNPIVASAATAQISHITKMIHSYSSL